MMNTKSTKTQLLRTPIVLVLVVVMVLAAMMPPVMAATQRQLQGQEEICFEGFVMDNFCIRTYLTACIMSFAAVVTIIMTEVVTDTRSTGLPFSLSLSLSLSSPPHLDMMHTHDYNHNDDDDCTTQNAGHCWTTLGSALWKNRTVTHSIALWTSQGVSTAGMRCSWTRRKNRTACTAAPCV